MLLLLNIGGPHVQLICTNNIKCNCHAPQPPPSQSFTFSRKLLFRGECHPTGEGGLTPGVEDRNPTPPLLTNDISQPRRSQLPLSHHGRGAHGWINPCVTYSSHVINDNETCGMWAHHVICITGVTHRYREGGRKRSPHTHLPIFSLPIEHPVIPKLLCQCKYE
ncbi:hypothetical protein CDAR_315581 [Caerostris darwini]|uniref:Uncharacterized protein n=1 Tax=Caerostris darwini TaxID=1538125 RepID=A0AAV4TRI8_9ARAC|nr:hypothetical protein CDAR_315581 [Caerostris darwini]